MESSVRREPPLLTPREIYERLDRYVIGQEAAKRAVSIAAHTHLKRIHARRGRRTTLLKKSNILLVGPTGCGKTHIARHLAEVLSVPFTVVDATEYTEAGYYGKDVEVMVAELLLKADHSVEDTQRGIIFIDEVDKIARRTQGARNGAAGRDIGGEGVQQALLKLLEGREVYVPMSVSQAWSRSDFVPIDTRDILFICAGTFSDLHEAGEAVARPLGFGAAQAQHPSRRLTLKQLMDYGMLAEFLGRLPVFVQLERLSEAELMRVLMEPPDSILREYRELLALDGVELDLTRAALHEVVRYTVGRGLGARGLRAVLEHVMSDVLFEAPERSRHRVTVDEVYVQAKLGTLEAAGLSV